MNYKTKSIEGIIYTSYLTKYNISDVYESFEYDAIDEYSFYLINTHNQKSDDKLTNIHINKAYSEMQECLDMLKYFGVKPVSLFSQDYPQQLKGLKNMPPMLYVKGKLKKRVNAAIIGTRDASQFAYDNTKRLVELFSEHNYGIVSGLALGIDTIAHSQALSNKAYTISVLATPLNSIYPKENYGLASDIVESGGALISELPFSINRGRKSFVERNRIITALSKYVAPIEMGINSGTMSAVNFCKSQKKELLLQRPHRAIMSLKQFEGINQLIEEQTIKKHPRIKILEQGFTWDDIDEEKRNLQGHLF